MLEERGLWEETAAMIKRALMHRLLLYPELTAGEVWTRRMWMHDVPCPVTEEEAADWRRTHTSRDS